LFYVLLRLENKFGDGQVKRHYHNKIIAVFIGCILNLAIIGAFSGISTLLVRFAGKVKTGSGARYARYAACAMSAGAA
jgi:succinate dehydrogenase/fumarate reductase cytochrome b subunit